MIVLIKFKDKNPSVYKGDYRPVEVVKNGEKLHKYNVLGTNENEAEFEKTYNDYLTVYGKSGYGRCKNLCPPPESKTTNDGLIYTKISKEVNGKFDLEVTQVDTSGPIMLMSPIELHSVKLPAGTYTASSNCSYIGLCSDDEDLYDLPYTFTLDGQQTVCFGTYNIGIKETSVYIQIEIGDTASEYQHYFDPQKEPSPENIKPIISSGGKIETFGQNLFHLPTFKTSSTPYLKCDFDKTNQTITINGKIESKASEAATQIALSNELIFDFNEGEHICISRHIVSGSLEIIGTGRVLWGVFANGQTSGNYYSNRISEQEKDIFEKDKYINTKFPKKAASYSLLVQAFSGKSGRVVFDNLVVKIQVMKGYKNGKPYVPYFEPSTLEISALNGLIGVKQPIYEEQINGQEIYYLSDALEGDTLIKRIGEKVFTGYDSFCVYNELDKTTAFITEEARCGNGAKATSLCNAFKTLESADVDEEGVFITEEGKAIFRLNKERGINTSQGLKGMIGDYEYKGVPITLFYPLNEEEKSAVPNILKSYPCFTRVRMTTENGKMPFGLAGCIKSEQMY